MVITVNLAFGIFELNYTGFVELDYFEFSYLEFINFYSLWIYLFINFEFVYIFHNEIMIDFISYDFINFIHLKALIVRINFYFSHFELINFILIEFCNLICFEFLKMNDWTEPLKDTAFGRQTAAIKALIWGYPLFDVWQL